MYFHRKTYQKQICMSNLCHFCAFLYAHIHTFTNHTQYHSHKCYLLLMSSTCVNHLTKEMKSSMLIAFSSTGQTRNFIWMIFYEIKIRTIKIKTMKRNKIKYRNETQLMIRTGTHISGHKTPRIWEQCDLKWKTLQRTRKKELYLSSQNNV